MLTTVYEGLVSGIRNVEWDAVEIASQFGEELANATENLAQFPEDLEAWAEGS